MRLTMKPDTTNPAAISSPVFLSLIDFTEKRIIGMIVLILISKINNVFVQDSSNSNPRSFR